MSFWDSIKPAPPPPSVTGVQLSSDKRVVELAWSDGKTTRISARTLRQVCPCAACVDEWTQKLRFDPARVPESTTVQKISPVGNYALAFAFSDSHDSGIFTFELLRSASEKHPA
ncbi:MAG: DUF971 domain-containing protein [Myxococcaceae bacterium]|nr:DUF971 domain-containing protein [Myxococcaceae bacterium]